MKPHGSVFKQKRNYIFLGILLLILIKQVFAAPLSDAIEPHAVYVIVNEETPQQIISKNGLSAIFKMRLRHWRDGSPVTVFVLPDDNPLHKLFCKQILNVFPHQMRRSWNKLVFSGTGQAPIEVADKEEMLHQVSTTVGAIGYINGEDLNERVKILEIE